MNDPTIFVILGATGDLMKKKIIPALFALYQKQALPNLFHLIGFSRRPFSTEEFRKYIRTIAPDVTDEFLRLCTYHQGQLEHAPDYTKLARSLGRMDGAHSKTGGCCCTGYRSVAAGSAGIKRN